MMSSSGTSDQMNGFAIVTAALAISGSVMRGNAVSMPAEQRSAVAALRTLLNFINSFPLISKFQSAYFLSGRFRSIIRLRI